jgi:hypothetical protein
MLEGLPGDAGPEQPDALAAGRALRSRDRRIDRLVDKRARHPARHVCWRVVGQHKVRTAPRSSALACRCIICLARSPSAPTEGPVQLSNRDGHAKGCRPSTSGRSSERDAEATQCKPRIRQLLGY